MVHWRVRRIVPGHAIGHAVNKKGVVRGAFDKSGMVGVNAGLDVNNRLVIPTSIDGLPAHVLLTDDAQSQKLTRSFAAFYMRQGRLTLWGTPRGWYAVLKPMRLASLT